MQALASLHNDHHVLLALTDTLDAFAVALGGSDDFGPPEVGEFARAFREFADHVHYEKEEHVFLPFLARHGFDWNGELIEQVRHDHCRDRYLIDVLYQAGQREGSFSNEDRRRLAATASALASAQRDLTMKQDIELLPEVVSLFDAPTLERLHAELSSFDARTGERAVQLRKGIRALTARYD